MQARKRKHEETSNNQALASSQQTAKEQLQDSTTSLEQPPKKQRKTPSPSDIATAQLRLRIKLLLDQIKSLQLAIQSQFEAIATRDSTIAQLNQTIQFQAADIARLDEYVAELDTQHAINQEHLTKQYKKTLDYQNAEITRLISLAELPPPVFDEYGILEYQPPVPNNEGWLTIHNNHSRELNARNARITELETENVALKKQVEELKAPPEPQSRGTFIQIPASFFNKRPSLPQENTDANELPANYNNSWLEEPDHSFI